MRLRNILPLTWRNLLFGNREVFGFIPDIADRDWIIWQKNAVSDFYKNTQRSGIGNRICRLTDSVIDRIEFKDKRILEIGPGIIRHLRYIKNKPAKYTICDINNEILTIAHRQLVEAKIECQSLLLKDRKSERLPFDDKSFDIIISFYSLEHLYPLDAYLVEMKRVLCDGGQVVGGIPCEGGLAWGLGRLLTTRKYVKKNYNINYEKIICWEHPNFIDFIIRRLGIHFKPNYFKLHPFSWLPIDFNLVASFIFKNPL